MPIGHPAYQLSDLLWQLFGLFVYSRVATFDKTILLLKIFLSHSDYIMNKKKLRFVRIQFDTSTYDKITKDKAASFVDKFSAIGGTLGLLTGFSIISGVEILYFAVKIAIKYFSQFRSKPNYVKNKVILHM